MIECRPRLLRSTPPFPCQGYGQAEGGIIALHAQQLPAGLFTVPAGFSTDATVLVHARMAGALLAAGLAHGGAGLDHMFQHRSLRFTATAHQHTRSGCTHIGAVLIESNTAHKLIHHLLGEAGVGADRARTGALGECLHHLGEPGLVDATLFGMCP